MKNEKFKNHPTVINYYTNQQRDNDKNENNQALDLDWLKNLAIRCGADDVGIVSVDSPDLLEQKSEILELLHDAKTLISFVCKVNREPVRSPSRSIANTEFHHTIDKTNEVGHKIASELEEMGIRAMNTSSSFPMEVDKEGKPWIISHKPIAEAAGLGKIGFNRLVIHPKYGNFILLGTVIINKDVNNYSEKLNFNPCFECKLCVSACPVGAIEPDGSFNFSSCFNHNYREFFGGFNDWVDHVVTSKNREEYHNHFTIGETSSMWQSLSTGANYKAAYCMSVCPAGENVIGQYIEDRKGFIKDVVKPLQKKEETLYISKNSDAIEYAKKRFPNKSIKIVSSGLRATTIKTFKIFLPDLFQKNRSKGLQASYNFEFIGNEEVCFSVEIKNKTIKVKDDLLENPDVRVTADSETWVKVLNQEKSLIQALLFGKLKVSGQKKLLLQFKKCFPS
ncbi:SCP2 sterol-binding domain-containing protein [Cytobacillus sp. Hm23]